MLQYSEYQVEDTLWIFIIPRLVIITFTVNTAIILNLFQAPEADYIDAAVVSVLQIHLTQPPGDILVGSVK